MLSGAPHLRASDDDREVVRSWLHVNRGEGRLDDAELADRLGRAETARTVHDLEKVINDLPVPEVDDDDTLLGLGPPRLQSLADVQAVLVLPVVLPAIILALTSGPTVWPIWLWLVCLLPIVWAITGRVIAQRAPSAGMAKRSV